MSDSGKKRFTLKPFRSHHQLDKKDATDLWEILAKAIDEIYNRNASKLSFEELYRNAYTLVLNKHGALLYEGVTEKLSNHLYATVQQLVATAENKLLETMSVQWNDHCTTMFMIRDVLMYMDRTYVVQQKRRPVYELGLHLFRITVWEHPAVKQRVIDLLLQAIANERSGMLIDDRNLFKSIITMLLELGRADYTAAVYQQDFEQVFLGTTQEFYNLESLQYLSHATATDYVRKAAERLEEEKDRVIALQLPISTEGPLQNIIQTEWIERHATQLVEMESTGFAALLNDNDESKLQEMLQMYDVFVRVPTAVDHLRDALAERIKRDGKKLIVDQERGQSDPSTFVKGVLQMRNKYDRIVAVSFRNEKKAQKRMKESFEDFLNIDARAASCLAVYVDELLRTGLRAVITQEEQINEELNKVIVVFRYLSDKDVFESFYKQHLAKRLLGGRSLSEDAEKIMVSLLKAECGYQFTTKLEGMFNDMRISRETRDKYKSYVKKRKNQHQQQGDQQDNIAAAESTKQLLMGPSQVSTMDIEVDVLTTGYWPSQSVPPCILPAVVQEAMEQFTTFYLNEHTGRKLAWQTSAGAAELKATFGGGSLQSSSSKAPSELRRHELSVSTYQMCILLLFNENDTLTLGQIRSQTQIPDTELRRHLISLCTPKNRILKKGSRGKGITADNDTFTFNNDYTSKLKRVRIPLVKETSITTSNIRTDGTSTVGGGSGHGAVIAAAVAGINAVGGSATTSATSAAAATLGDGAILDGSVPVAVEEDRRHLVEAAIVRIMKARKSLNHNDLIAEVTKQLSIRFIPTPQFIKKRIESLIEREYLERSNTEHRLYLYVA